MKAIKWIISAALVFGLFVPVVKGFIFDIDGIADPGYGSAISTQTLGTAAGDNTETNQGYNDGSELDAAYGVISNGVLYLVLSGNFDSDHVVDNAPNDQFHIFFMADSGVGGITNIQAGWYLNALYTNRFDRMASNGGINNPNPGAPGLTFDTGFYPGYWIGFNVGQPDPVPDPTLPSQMFANYQVLTTSNGLSVFLGQAYCTNFSPNNIVLAEQDNNANGIELAIVTTNTAGVDGYAVLGGTTNGTVCTTNAEDGLQSTNAAAVRTGVEMAIPLVAIGNPTGSVSICAFITDQACDTMYNQVLGPITPTIVNNGTTCQAALGDPSGVNLGTLPGHHYFTLPVPPCNVIGVNPSNVSFGPDGGTSNETVTLNGGSCGWAVTSSVSWVTFPSATNGVGDGSFTYTVATNTISYFPITGTLTIYGTTVPVTQTVYLTESGEPVPPPSTLGIVTVDGTADAVYACPVAVQQIGTGFGDNSEGNITNANGSELDAAYGLVQNNVLFLFLAGNLEINFHTLNLFFMTGPGGTNTLVSGNNTNQLAGRLGILSGTTNAATPGFTFNSQFKPNYCMILNGGNSPFQFFVDYAQLWPGGTNSSGYATNAYYVGYSLPTNGTLFAGSNPYGIQATINNLNTNGVDTGIGGGIGCTTTNNSSVSESSLASNVYTGIELAIPLAALGNPTGQIAVVAFIADSGEYVSNQFLPPIDPTIGNNGTNCWINLGATTNLNAINLNTVPISPYFTVGPEMRITSVSRVISGTTNVNVNVLPENNPNMLYRLQSTVPPLTTNSTWVNVTGNTAGTNVVLTFTDTHATNGVGKLYRVQQSPNCTPP